MRDTKMFTLLIYTLFCVCVCTQHVLRTRYSCDSKPGMRTGSCDMTCSPDRITPQCPVFNCVSASPGTCGTMRCEVNTYSHVLYWLLFNTFAINPPLYNSFLQQKNPASLSICVLFFILFLLVCDLKYHNM